MEQAKQVLEILAAKLHLTSFDDGEKEDYILTPEEEKSAIDHAIRSAKEHFQFLQLEKGELLGNIENKISNINWEEEINKDELLKRCNSNKHQELWFKEQRKKEAEQKKNQLLNLQKAYTAENVYKFMAYVSRETYDKKLFVTDWNRQLIAAICFFISNDIRFETQLGYSFKKGLLLRGISGIGKTFLIKCVKDNELNPVVIHSMIEITDAVRDNGFIELRVGEKILYLDDVGTEEPNVKCFGTTISFFKNFIENYYMKDLPFNKLIISTNNSFDELESKYGFRVRSRLKDMFNIIDVDGKDLRG